MNNILTVTEQASKQLKKIFQSAPSDTVGILLVLIKQDAMVILIN